MEAVNRPAVQRASAVPAIQVTVVNVARTPIAAEDSIAARVSARKDSAPVFLTAAPAIRARSAATTIASKASAVARLANALWMEACATHKIACCDSECIVGVCGGR